MNTTLDRQKSVVITCRQCGSDDLESLRHWNTPSSGKPFEPTHHCRKCGLDFIYRTPKEKLRDFMRD